MSCQTWGEFKAQVEAAGVTDETPIGYIDMSCRIKEVRPRGYPPPDGDGVHMEIE